MSTTFDPLEFVNQLKAVNVPDAQAQVQARVLRQALDGQDQTMLALLEQQIKALESRRIYDAAQMATKDDLRLLEGVMATKEDLRLLESVMATKDDLRLLESVMATKEELRLMADSMATKEELQTVKIDVQALKGDVQALKGDVQGAQTDIALLRKDMEMMRKDLIIKVGSMFVVSVGTILAAIGMAVRYLA